MYRSKDHYGPFRLKIFQIDTYFHGLPSEYYCWSRQDVNQTLLKDYVMITTEYSNEGIDVSYISASFEFNGTQLNCLSNERWAQNFPFLEEYGTTMHLCITNVSLLATFSYELLIYGNGSFNV